MYGVVSGAFRMLDYSEIYNPTKTVKFNLATNSLTSSFNSVYTFCDFLAFFNNFQMYLDYSNYEQYI